MHCIAFTVNNAKKQWPWIVINMSDPLDVLSSSRLHLLGHSALTMSFLFSKSLVYCCPICLMIVYVAKGRVAVQCEEAPTGRRTSLFTLKRIDERRFSSNALMRQGKEYYIRQKIKVQQFFEEYKIVSL